MSVVSGGCDWSRRAKDSDSAARGKQARVGLEGRSVVEEERTRRRKDISVTDGSNESEPRKVRCKIWMRVGWVGRVDLNEMG